MMKAHVIGNAALDETLRVADFPQPGASIFGEALSQDLGGKGVNQAVAIARTGLPCRLVAAVGEDARGREIAARLAAEPLAAELIALPVASDRSLILMAGHGENAVITTRAAASAMTPEHVEKALAEARPGDLLVLQGNLRLATTRAALIAARARGLRTALNPSPLEGDMASLLPMVDCVFVNEGEARLLDGSEALRAAGVSEVVVTLGGRGAVLLHAGHAVEVPARAVAIVDTTGAGDCFMAVALASAGLRGTRLDARALRHATAAAALTVSRPGTVAAFPDAAQMLAILAQD
ncbi:PfkB family carbohydrate kinase [Paracoccus sp. (in: a-proteobacteria)]|uniref:PfkB family carbohydrate kinase n=1 Tax=Paracoccus sp. TaxID=267 RepID=UPI00272D88D5|nr:PfkB family carbohydrate kinase [Paracoccus sp. (in: a-proteobacteria)]